MLRAILRSVVLVLAIAPIAGLGLGALASPGPEGPEFSAFGAGIVLIDPFVRAAIGNSVATSGVATLLAAAAGVVVARASRRLGEIARRAAGLFERLGMCCDPFTAAIGLTILAPKFPTGLLDSLPRDGSTAWLLLIACQAGFGSAWIAHHAGRAMDAIPAACVEIGAMSGGSQGWIWRAVTWPLIRPTVARATATVFAVVLLEPGGPLVLGLRGTIGFQVVQAVFDNGTEDWARPSVLAAVGVACSVLVRLVLLRSAGRDELTETFGDAAPPGPRPDRARSGLSGRLVDASSMLAILLWGGFILLPFRGLSIGIGAASMGPGDFAFRSLLPFLSTSLGLAGRCMPLLLIAAMAMSRGSGGARRRDGMLEAVPPIAFGVGLLAAAGLIRRWASGASGDLAMTPGTLAVLLDPYRTPAVAATWAASAAMLPWLLNGRGFEERRPPFDPSELARMVGDRRMLGRLVTGWVRGKGRLVVGSAILATQAGLALSPGIVAAPMEPCRPMGAWALMAWDGGGPAVPLVLARVLIGLVLVVVATAPRRGIGPSILVRG